ncbi:GNAT family N-acetyltransferase [Kaistia geumhonensis]|uniref:GNAT superfamily N-acetyltransferase n=1 Tax=Kaistia geumhonensis TaxID=410839 RepID=A0ABU0M6F6_9HYPH|nr:GNAT family N-acetyltransferase [Kaistia geumhonensis]MCX5478409.1 GNAT family N-acetyltransferase [Kaistia geumhonensis]MDQ0516373.1 GNAT superfamily N-acetyltransferase [Kaistia geumhonensis]
MDPSAPPIVRPFRPADTEGVAAVIVPIQQSEFGIPIRYEDQPDLLAIPDFYQSGAGGFWVAEAADGSIVGTIGLRDIGGGMAALRKMFVASGHRGDGTARRLLDTLVAHAKAAGLRTVLLGTTARFLAAHRFYEKNGFVEIATEELPASFPRMAVDTKFYRLQL